MSEEDVVAMVSKLQEEKDREIQVVQALLSENLAREASLRYDNEVRKRRASLQLCHPKPNRNRIECSIANPNRTSKKEKFQ